MIRGGGQDPLDRRDWKGGALSGIREGEGQDPLGPHVSTSH